jgi:DNA-binding PadR family transcriptional regulator
VSAVDPCPDRHEVDGHKSFEPGLGGGAGRRLLLEAAVLAALAGRSGHGYDLRRTVAELTGGFALIDSGSLYRLLRRLEQDGLVTSAWADGEFGPQRREYRLTEHGCQRLVAWRPHLEARERAFRSVIQAIDSLSC